MDFLDHTYPDLWSNLAADELLLLEAESGQRREILRLWEMPSLGVAIGSGGKIAEEIHEEACVRHGVPFARRSSGGGTVILGPGCLCYSLVLELASRPQLEGITASYEWILERVARSLEGLTQAIQVGSSDLAEGDFKFSGNAQQRKKGHILHHGTLLYGMATDQFERFLPHPPREPEYRNGRNHRAFCRNLATTRADLAQRLKTAFAADQPGLPPDDGKLGEMVREKYATDAWLRRR